MKVRDIMTPSVITIDCEDTIESAAKLMSEYNIGAIPVKCNSDLKGIITDRDIVIRKIAKGDSPANSKVKDYMSQCISTIGSDSDIQDALKIMARDQVRRLPVVDNGNVIGMIALGDIATSNNWNMETASALCEISEGCGHNGNFK